MALFRRANNFISDLNSSATEPKTEVQIIPTYVEAQLHNIVKLHLHIDGRNNPLNNQLLTALKDSIRCMPYENFSILKIIIMHLKRITLHQKGRAKAMTAKSLGIVFGPSFAEKCDDLTAFEAKSLILRWNGVVEMLIQNSDLIFGKTYMTSECQLKREAAAVPKRKRMHLLKDVGKSKRQASLYKNCLLNQALITEQQRMEEEETNRKQKEHGCLCGSILITVIRQRSNHSAIVVPADAATAPELSVIM
ncbi:rho GTPase-activating protein 42-like [Antedon mediterranea]|uniref:rho GTPase-activating protein 42-like n=1 Tax=Antedon mediterranea TaxID=105859 RepID=UPI003AF55AA6